MNVASRLPDTSAAALADRPAKSAKPPFLGFGLGLRHQHYDEILNGNPPIDWFEVISENYMLPGGQPLRTLDRICERYPVVMHGVSMSIASTAPPNFEYLQALKDLARRVEPKWVSDHLCWTGVHGKNLHDLLPIPYTSEALDHVVSRVQLVQEFLGRAIVLENVSTYVQFNNSEMTEWEFLSELSRRSGCWLLFDVNNVYVSAFNHGYDPMTFLNGIPADRVVQFHMAGHSHMGTHIIDTHDHPVCEDVWELYAAALKRFGRVSTMIERDDNIPPLDELLLEVARTREMAGKVLPRGMSDFARQQAEFQRGILDGDETVLAEILDSPREKRDVLFGVYRYAYGSRLVEAMRNDHELLHLYLGDEMFDEMGHAYVKARPSGHPNLRWFSQGLPAFLKSTAPYSEHPVLSDLAALEKALNDAFDAAEGKVVELTDMAGFAPEAWSGLRFRPHPSASRLELATNAAAIWLALKNDEAPPEATALGQPAHLLIWRQDVTPMFRELAEEEAMMWDEAANGIPFGVLCEMLATYDDPDSAAGRGAGYLHGWITAGLLTDVSVGS